MPKKSSSNKKTGNDLRSYDEIRTLLRHAYLYGSFSDSDILDSGLIDINKRELAYMWNRFHNYFATIDAQQNFLQTHNLPERKQNKKAHRICYDPFRCNIDFLASTYRHFTINSNDLFFYLLFLFCFSDDEEQEPYDAYWPEESVGLLPLSPSSPFTFEQLRETMLDFYEENGRLISGSCPEDDAFVLSDSTLRRQLKDLVDAGLLLTFKEGSKILYQLPPDIFSDELFGKDMKTEHLREFYSMVLFFYNITPMAVPGYFVKDLLFSRLIFEADYEESKTEDYRNHLFLYSKTNLQNLLDEDLMWELLGHMSKNHVVTYDYDSAQMRILPIKFVLDWQYGRHYLFGYCYDSNNIVTHRIDRIKNVKEIPTPEKPPMHMQKICKNLSSEKLTEAYFHALMDSSWNVGARAEKTLVKIYFNLPEKEDLRSYYYSKLYRTPFGADVITQKNATELEMNVFVAQPMEMIPWIQGFGKFARVDREICPQLYAQLEKNKQELKKLYESV